MDAIAQWLGVEVDSAGDGSAVLRMTVEDRHVHGGEVAHGGVLFTLADTALSYAAILPGFGLTTWAHVVFIAPALMGDVVIASAVVESSWGSNHLVDVHLSVGTRAVAAFRGQARAPLPVKSPPTPL